MPSNRRAALPLLLPLLLSGACLESGAWLVQSSPTTAGLNAVWGSSAIDVYAVGANGTILHSDDRGTTWKVQESGSTRTLYAVWGSGPTDVYAVGELGTILHSDGKTWQARDAGGTTATLSGVWGSAANDVYVVGAGVPMLRSSDGVTWTVRANLGFTALVAVWGSGRDDVYAVGTDGTIGQSGIVHLTNGGATTTSTTKFPADTQLRSVGGARANEVFVVGKGLLYKSTDQGVTWVGEGQTGFSQDLACVWGHPQQGVYAVGADATIVYQSMSRGSFLVETSKSSHNLRGVWGDGIATLLAVGDLGTILR